MLSALPVLSFVVVVLLALVYAWTDWPARAMAALHRRAARWLRRRDVPALRGLVEREARAAASWGRTRDQIADALAQRRGPRDLSQVITRDEYGRPAVKIDPNTGATLGWHPGGAVGVLPDQPMTRAEHHAYAMGVWMEQVIDAATAAPLPIDILSDGRPYWPDGAGHLYANGSVRWPNTAAGRAFYDEHRVRAEHEQQMREARERAELQRTCPHDGDTIRVSNYARTYDWTSCVMCGATLY